MRINRYKVNDWIDIGTMVILGLALLSILVVIVALLFGLATGGVDTVTNGC